MLTPADWIIIAIVGLSGLLSIFRGFIKEAISLIAWVCAFVITSKFYEALAQKLTFISDDEMVRNGIACLILFIATLCVVGLCGSIIRAFIHKVGLSGTDRLLGMVFGVLRGILIVCVILALLQIGFKGAKVDHFTKFIVKTNSKWLNEVKVSGNGNFMLNSEYTGDEMTIKANANSLVQLKNKVTVGKLNLDVSGSANMVANNIEVDKLECDIDGSGSITLKKGTAKEGDFGIVSSGDLHALGIEIPRIECSVTGNGLAELRPTKNLKANVIGKGKIRYKGPTAVEQRVIGKGTIEEIH